MDDKYINTIKKSVLERLDDDDLCRISLDGDNFNEG